MGNRHRFDIAFVGLKPGVHEFNYEVDDKFFADFQQVAKYENVFCKISGFVTEADIKNWKEEDFIPYFDVVVEAFGVNRIIFGSDWPVCLLGAEYPTVTSILEKYFSAFTQSERDQFFGTNAINFYNL